MESSEELDTWRYVIMLAKFMMHFLHNGLIRSLSVLIPYLAFQLDMEYSTSGFLVTLQAGIYYIACPVSCYLAHKFGCRRVTIISCFLSAISLLAGSFSQSATFLGCSYFLTGLFSSPLRQMSNEMLHQHYGKHGYGFAQTVTQLGSQVGSFLMPYIVVFTLDAYGVRGSLFFLSAMAFHGVATAATLHPPRFPQGPSATNSSIRRNGDGPELEPLQTGDESESPTSKEESMDLETDKSLEKNEDHNPQHSKVDMLRNMIHQTFDFFNEELVFTFLLLPCQILFDITFAGWEVFLFSYGITEGLSKDKAVYTVMMGSIGGLVGRFSLIAILYKFPLVTLYLVALNMGIVSVTLLVYPISSSLTYLAICSFFAGFGFCNAFSSFYGAVSLLVRKENFPKAIASSLMLCGISYLLSGILTGYMYDLFGSYRAVFRVLGIMSGAASSAITIYICVDSSRNKKKSF
ncbi:monocarboxylate transporter 7-like [Lytechinus pictus]|uniref:monocarboxylate transporter 7-like n=1 Tax=Lytechinus pictus TaxID=7653 RepID=UPI0030B9DF91